MSPLGLFSEFYGILITEQCFSHCTLRFPELQLSATSVKTVLKSLNHRRIPKGAYLSIILVTFVEMQIFGSQRTPCFPTKITQGQQMN